MGIELVCGILLWGSFLVLMGKFVIAVCRGTI